MNERSDGPDVAGGTMRLAVDTGGTFTDLIVEDGDGALAQFKASTTPESPVEGVLDAVQAAADAMECGRRDLLSRGSLFIYATTRATNAILTGGTAKTAFLTTKGHRDILLLREGGRTKPFDFTREYPQPYIPRALTFEVPERVGWDGEVVQPLDEEAVVDIAAALREREIEAVAVCLLWSISNPAHELRIGELLGEHLPGVPVTLSHELNPSLREYRRASSTAIDASLKPLMSDHVIELESRLRAEGFAGRLLMVTATGGLIDVAGMADAPIHSIGSGPAMAPIAGRHVAALDADYDMAVVADTGGTSYDVSLVRRGRIPRTRETWLGEVGLGYMTGLPSVHVNSIGSGGGSIAWVDEGGLLRLGPHSAGAVPGPACYGRGGELPTVTDACLVLGFLDPEFFLGGAMRLDEQLATRAVEEHVAAKVGMSVNEAAAAMLRVATEHMARAIEEITVNQGIDPRDAVLIAGGGAAGLNSIAIARRIGSPAVVIPEIGATLSAAGALISDLSRDFAAAYFTTSTRFDRDGVNARLAELEEKCREFIAESGQGELTSEIEFFAEARYTHQVWDLEIPLRVPRFSSDKDVEQLVEDFHQVHEDVFTLRDPDSAVEIVAWRATARCQLRTPSLSTRIDDTAPGEVGRRSVYFDGAGELEAAVYRFETLEVGAQIQGPAIIESAFTTVVVDPGAKGERASSGSMSINPGVTQEVRNEVTNTV